ncbi:hypothetical protein BLL42_26890 (plasmid) [Pseudomonas frederiksbergensis]|uniref:Uncharacterized protein n=1 Tax=Pseudomonas frederiksbergensis TaxID=104087 RepID=A0A1J0ETR6_9PSED|nr:hypothetical protein [Pseudomonas frederiksbergensis]APC19371.1 hypothetical protein BLL42_26890 [Pseudomonas frederiksbergensis]
MTIPPEFQQACLLILVLYLAPILVIRAWTVIFSLMTNKAWSIFVWTGAIGVPIHEASHLLACWIFGLKPTNVVFFRPDRSTGTLGYVNFRYRPRSVRANLGLFVQGIAPLISGALVVSLCLSHASGKSTAPLFIFDSESNGAGVVLFVINATLNTLTMASEGILSGFTGALTVCFAACVSLHAIPSWADIRIGLRGAVALLITTLFGIVSIGALSEVTGVGTSTSLTSKLQPLIGEVGSWLTSSLSFALYGTVSVMTLTIVTTLAAYAVSVLLKAVVNSKPWSTKRARKQSSDDPPDLRQH